MDTSPQEGDDEMAMDMDELPFKGDEDDEIYPDHQWMVLQDIVCDRSGQILAKKGTIIEGHVMEYDGETGFEPANTEWTIWWSDERPMNRYLSLTPWQDGH